MQTFGAGLGRVAPAAGVLQEAAEGARGQPPAGNLECRTAGRGPGGRPLKKAEMRKAETLKFTSKGA